MPLLPNKTNNGSNMDPEGDQQLCRGGKPSTLDKCDEDPTAQQPALCGWNYYADSANLTPRLCNLSCGEKRSLIQ